MYRWQKQKGIKISGKTFSGLANILEKMSEQITTVHREICGIKEYESSQWVGLPYACLDSNDIRESIREYETLRNLPDDFVQGHGKFATKPQFFAPYNPEEIDAHAEIDPPFEPTVLEGNSTIAQSIATGFDVVTFMLQQLMREICYDVNRSDSNTEYVTIVAEPKVHHQVHERLLVLDLINSDKYGKFDQEKEKVNWSKWRVQIPNPIDAVDWSQLESITWERGVHYCTLEITNFAFPISGYFRNKLAAYSYFDQILGLTKETEVNRTYNEHESPKIRPVVQTTVVQKGYLTTLDPSTGEAIDTICIEPNR